MSRPTAMVLSRIPVTGIVTRPGQLAIVTGTRSFSSTTTPGSWSRDALLQQLQLASIKNDDLCKAKNRDMSRTTMEHWEHELQNEAHESTHDPLRQELETIREQERKESARQAEQRANYLEQKLQDMKYKFERSEKRAGTVDYRLDCHGYRYQAVERRFDELVAAQKRLQRKSSRHHMVWLVTSLVLLQVVLVDKWKGDESGNGSGEGGYDFGLKHKLTSIFQSEFLSDHVRDLLGAVPTVTVTFKKRVQDEADATSSTSGLKISPVQDEPNDKLTSESKREPEIKPQDKPQDEPLMTPDHLPTPESVSVPQMKTNDEPKVTATPETPGTQPSTQSKKEDIVTETTVQPPLQDMSKEERNPTTWFTCLTLGTLMVLTAITACERY